MLVGQTGEETLVLEVFFSLARSMSSSTILAIRHTYKESGLPSRAAATPERVLAYTREQHHVGKFPKEPARHWLIFMGEGGRRSRLTAVYENRGEAVAERTERHRYYDVAPVRCWPPSRSAW